MSVEIKEATKVNAFRVEGEKGLFRKVARSEAAVHDNECGEGQKAVRALFGSTISWFIPFNPGE